MKQLFLLASIAFSTVCYAQTNPNHEHVSGYTKKNGDYVAPHERSAPNRTQKDNYSTKGNTNPYTGKSGTKRAKR